MNWKKNLWRSDIKVKIILYGIARASPALVKENLANLQTYWPEGTIFDTRHIVLKLKEINNPRSGEKFVQTDLQLYAAITDQLIIKTVDELEELCPTKRSVLQNYEDVYEDNRKSLNNLFNQLLLLDYAVKSIISKSSHDNIVFCRDDILIKKRILTNCVLAKANEIIVPGFHWHKGYNDRFMFGTKEVAILWAGRITHLNKFYHKQKYLTGEKLVKSILDESNITILSFPRVFPRIRHNDYICKERNTMSINRPTEFIHIIRTTTKLLLRALF